jgi:AraC-like DNA-binding protein
VLESHARILIDRLPSSPTFAARVSEALVPMLPEGPTIDRVAHALRVSPRSVQRYLHAEDTSFERVLEDVRKSRAQAGLRDRRCSIAEVSAALGFADQSAFHRAFVRWMGTTPGAYRRASR